jgi:hypothetical protein
MRRLSVKPKRISNKISMIDDGIAFDDARRLRNALLALAQMDVGWMFWVERHVPRRMSVKITRMMVEQRARQLSAQTYSFLGNALVRGITESDYYFTDDGNLKTYR